MCAYLDFYTGERDNYALARSIAARYSELPSVSWRLLFQDISNQLHELDGVDSAVEPEDNEERGGGETRVAAQRSGL